MGSQLRPLLVSKNHYSNLASRKILLITQVLIGGQQDFESGRFGSCQQLAVPQRAPALLRSGSDLVLLEIDAYGNRRGLIEKYSNLGRMFWQSIKTPNGEFNNGFDLFAIKPIKPLQDVVNVRAGFKVFEDGGNGHTRALQHPGSTDFAGNAFHHGTF